jgi:hypothetical protein
VFSLRRRASRRSAGFVLLEVIVSMVIMGIALGTLMRSFTLSMKAIRKNDIITQGCVLAEGLLQDLEVNPPASKTLTGDFEDLGFPEFSYEVKYKEEDIRYRGLKATSEVKDLRPLRSVQLQVFHRADREHDAIAVAEVYTLLAPIEHWSYESKFLNELFRDLN